MPGALRRPINLCPVWWGESYESPYFGYHNGSGQ
jgi:hypothetical protein